MTVSCFTISSQLRKQHEFKFLNDTHDTHPSNNYNFQTDKQSLGSGFLKKTEPSPPLKKIDGPRLEIMYRYNKSDRTKRSLPLKTLLYQDSNPD